MSWQDGSFYKGGWKKDQQSGLGEIYSHVEGLKKCRFANNKIIEVLSH